MKVEIIIPRAVSGEFSRIELSYHDSNNNEVSVPLNIKYENIFKFTNIKGGVAFDVFMIGCCVYGIDILLPRKDFSFNGWSRDIEVCFPLEQPDLFENGKETLTTILTFLTGDNWDISFEERTELEMFKPRDGLSAHDNQYREEFKKVSLFSGGLDSLIGVIDELNSSDEKLVLVSHYDSVFKGAKSDQDKTINHISRKYESYYYHLQSRVDVNAYDINERPIYSEKTLRGRSFLFLSKAILVATSLGENIEINIPENGTISLNHPLTSSRKSSCSTRTAHPYYIDKVNEFISILNLNHVVKNKYEFKTKGEMVEDCLDKETLLLSYSDTCSCAKRGTRKDIRDIGSGTNHCGICMPCIYRRVALHKVGLDDEVVGTDLFNPIKYSLSDFKTDISALIYYLSTPLDVKSTERNLLVNGSLSLEKSKEYAEVVVRTRQQIIEWIKDKGSAEIKNRLGIR